LRGGFRRISRAEPAIADKIKELCNINNWETPEFSFRACVSAQ